MSGITEFTFKIGIDGTETSKKMGGFSCSNSGGQTAISIYFEVDGSDNIDLIAMDGEGSTVTLNDSYLAVNTWYSIAITNVNFGADITKGISFFDKPGILDLYIIS